MLAWLRDLSSRERRTMLACWGGWTLDGFDQQLYAYVVPTVIALWGISTGAAGTIGTVTVVTSSFGGWFAGALADRYGRVRVLQVAILWYSLVTFLCGFAQNFEQLFFLRALHGLGFGGEWATGAVLMGEVIRDKYRGRGVGFVQTGAAFGPGLAALVYAGLYAILPEAIAWRTLFWVGILPALLVLWIRRNIADSEAYQEQRRAAPSVGVSHLFAAFRGPYLWLTLKVSLMVMGAQGSVWAVQFWMPTYLRTVRHLSPSYTGLYVAVQMFGALIGFLIGAYCADWIGRRGTFMISAVATLIMVTVYIYVPVGDIGLLLLGIPLSASILMKFAPMGPYMTELYPTALRGTGQGFCYNAGRAIGSVFMTAIGFATAVMPLGSAIALFSGIAMVLMFVMLLVLPETHGRAIAGLEDKNLPPEPVAEPGGMRA
ncbi:MAG: MFS transporter [Alphaproteobacteria bacterium]|nr:MFS transporter [Alphaproteobacteria bacterium]